jgi:hypothetical protein
MVRSKVLITGFLLLASCSFAQDLPDAPSHHFLDKQNIVLLAATTTAIGLDGWSTQRLNPNWEQNPIARPLVTRGPSGQAVASALGLSAAALTAYTFHRMHHHRMERASLWLTTALETSVAIRNFQQ